MSTQNDGNKDLATALAIFDEALAARHAGRKDKAFHLCVRALALVPADQRQYEAGINGELGYIQLKRGILGSAEGYYQRATVLSPKSQLASVGLFHALFKQNKVEEALNEILRFVTLRDSVEYRELLRTGFRDDVADDYREIADRARRHLERHEIEASGCK